MAEECTTAVVQRYLDELACDPPADPVARALLDRAARRLHHLCVTLLYGSYPRLTRPPLNLQTDEMLGAVVERLLKALREARPAPGGGSFARACQAMCRGPAQHGRGERTAPAGSVKPPPPPVGLGGGLVPSPASSGTGITPDGRR